MRDDPILEISCGDEHTGVVTGRFFKLNKIKTKCTNLNKCHLNLEKGRAFMFGSNNWGQLGLGHEDNVDKPSCVKCIFFSCYSHLKKNFKSKFK